MCQLQQSSMAGGGGGAVSAVAFNFLEVWCKSFNIFLDTTFKWFSGSVLVSCPVSQFTREQSRSGYH